MNVKITFVQNIRTAETWKEVIHATVSGVFKAVVEYALVNDQLLFY